MNRGSLFLTAFLCALFLSQCKKDNSTDTTKKNVTSLQKAKKAPPKRLSFDLKTEHARLANGVLDAVIEGRLERVKKAGQWLADPLRLKELPGGWLEHWKAIQKAGQDLAQVSEQKKAAFAVAELAHACGNCHVAMKAKVNFKEQPLNDAGGGTKAFMVRHIWASARMWEAIVGPRDDTWIKGAQALAKDENLDKKIHATGELKKELRHWAREVYNFGKKAETVKDAKARVELLGSLMQGCFHCHQRMYVDLTNFPY